jgi:hypothetical protein
MADFVKNFNCKNEDHVMWLKKLGGVMAKSMSGERINVEAAVNDNPLPTNPLFLMLLTGHMYTFSYV